MELKINFRNSLISIACNENIYISDLKNIIYSKYMVSSKNQYLYIDNKIITDDVPIKNILKKNSNIRIFISLY